MREPSETDFTLEVEGIGNLTFGRRTMRDRFRISAEVTRLTEGEGDEDSGFVMVAEAYATLRVLLVAGPKDFTRLLDMDADADDGADEPVIKAYFALRNKEVESRKAATKSGEGEGEGTPADDGLVVPSALPAGADGPALP